MRKVDLRAKTIAPACPEARLSTRCHFAHSASDNAPFGKRKVSIREVIRARADAEQKAKRKKLRELIKPRSRAWKKRTSLSSLLSESPSLMLTDSASDSPRTYLETNNPLQQVMGYGTKTAMYKQR